MRPLTFFFSFSALVLVLLVLSVLSVLGVIGVLGVLVCARLAMPGSAFQHPGHDPWRVEYGPDEVKKDQNARDGRCIGHLVCRNG